jgi:hypothetical protein
MVLSSAENLLYPKPAGGIDISIQDKQSQHPPMWPYHGQPNEVEWKEDEPHHICNAYIALPDGE